MAIFHHGHGRPTTEPRSGGLTSPAVGSVLPPRDGVGYDVDRDTVD